MAIDRRRRGAPRARLEPLEARLPLSTTLACLGQHCRQLPAYVAGSEGDPPMVASPAESGGPLAPVSTTVSFQSVDPEGSLISRSVNSGDITVSGETDTFLFDLDAGQTVTIVVEPDATLQPDFVLYAPDSSALAASTSPGVGQPALQQTVAADTSGTYSIELTGAGAPGSIGDYSVTIYLNAAAEEEEFGGSMNDDLASAQDLNAAFVGLGAGVADRAAVIGRQARDLTDNQDLITENFESGGLNSDWTTASSDGLGRIRVSNEVPAAGGVYSLLMDRALGGDRTLNEAIWTVDLAAYTKAILNFSHARFDDEPDFLPESFSGSVEGDGVSISQDGVNWHRILDATPVAIDVWDRVSIDLIQAATTAEISLDSDFRIKFQQYDNGTIPTDGRGYDEIQITATFEDWHSFALDDGESASIVYKSVEPDYGAGLELYDVAGTLLATAASAGNADWTINRYWNSAGDGSPDTYYLRVVDPSDEYTLLVVREADFDRESNDSLSLPQDLGPSTLATGFVDMDSAADLTLQQSFSGPAYTGFTPPDPTLAVGPEQVVVLVNTELAIYDKATGQELFHESISDVNGFFGIVGATSTVFDPWVIFDDDSQRFFVVGIDVASQSRSNLFLAVSDDSTPTDGSDWHKYKLDFTHDPVPLGLGSGAHFPDYEKLGVNDDAIFVSGNYFPIGAGNGVYAGITAIEKSSLLSGSPANVLYEEHFAGFSVFPLNQFDSGSTQYFVEELGGSDVRLHAVTDVLGSPTRQTVDLTVPTYAEPVDVPQLGGGDTEPADAVSARFMTGVWRLGSAWFAHAITDPAIVDGETVVRWYEVATNNYPSGIPTLVQSGNVDPGPDLHAWMPAVAVDEVGNLAIGFSLGGPTDYYGAGFTGRLASDPLGVTMLPVTQLVAGRENYVRQDNSGRNRWGDYSGLAIDPAEDRTFWVFNEYADVNNRWATQIGSFLIDPLPDRDIYRFQVASGNELTIRTDTPFDGPNAVVNALDPELDLFAPDGTLIVSDSNSADGKNALLIHTASESGEYYVRVSSASGQGTYVLTIDGATGSEKAPQVAGSSPDDGQLLTEFPTVYRLEFSEQIAANSVSPNALSVDGVQAVAVSVMGEVVEFQLDVPTVVTEGTHTVQLLAGSVVDLQGVPLAAAFNATFDLDFVGPKVLATRWNGQAFPASGRFLPGMLEFEADVSEDLFLLASARRGPLSPGADDVILKNQLSGEYLSEDYANYDPDSDLFAARYDDLPEGNYTLTLVSGPGAFEDEAGNALDGEPLGLVPDKTPTGDDVPGGDYDLAFVVDEDTHSLQPFVRMEPWGSLIFRSTGNTGLINDATDEDVFSFYAHAGERITVRVQPVETWLQVGEDDVTLSAQLFGSAALGPAVSSPNPGQLVDLPPTLIPEDGFYELRITADKAVRFDAQLTRNADREERVGDAEDLNELAIDDSFVLLGSGRFAVVGHSERKLEFSQTNDPSKFVDISGSGMALNLLYFGEDEVTLATTVGNLLIPAGSITVGNNGGVVVSPYPNLSWNNKTLPAVDLDVALLPYWDDLETGYRAPLDIWTGNIYFAEQLVDGINTVIVQWEKLSHDNLPVDPVTGLPLDPENEVTFQLQLFETGDVLSRFVYEDIEFGNDFYDFGGSATIGYQESRDKGYQFSYGAKERPTPVDPDHPVHNGDVVDLFAVPDVDEYTLDLSGRVGQPLDVLLTGLEGADLAAEQLELLDENGTILATAVSDPLSVTADNFDLGLLDFVVPDIGSNVYTLRVSSLTPGPYSLVVTDSLVFDAEPNNLPTDPLRTLPRGPSGEAIGFLNGAADLDLYELDVVQGEPVSVTLASLLNDPLSVPLNDLNPEITVVASDGVTVLASDADSLDGVGAQLSFVAPNTETVTIRAVSTSGAGEYRLTTTTLAGLSIDGVSMNEGDSGTTPLTFTVSRTDNVGAVSVQVDTNAGSATAGVDYTTLSTIVSFVDGGALTQTVTVDVAGDGLVEPDEVFTVELSNANGAVIVAGTGLGTIVNDDAAPRIASVRVSSSDWTPAFLAEVDPEDGLGYPIPAGADQLAPLPWLDLNQIYVSFDKEVSGVDQTNLTLTGINVPDYDGSISEISYANQTATILLDTSIDIDSVLLMISDNVTDLAGNPLDGDWSYPTSSFPSGDETPGESFLFRINVLPGDVHQSEGQQGVVNIVDTFNSRNRQFQSIGDPSYLITHDVNGDGAINIVDTFRVRERQFTFLPVVPPQAAVDRAFAGDSRQYFMVESEGVIQDSATDVGVAAVDASFAELAPPAGKHRIAWMS